MGTGDLSELALGWCTYGVGDQMSHYNVNAGVPKTLIQHLIRWVVGVRAVRARGRRHAARRSCAPRSRPSWCRSRPASRRKAPRRKVGPYELQDFTLFYVLRYGFRPSQDRLPGAARLGRRERGAWPPGFPEDRRRAYRLPEIRHWLELFLRRFFGFSQFKRSAMPNGPKVAAGGSLSPRGDWRAPSDGTAAAWLEELARALPPP